MRRRLFDRSAAQTLQLALEEPQRVTDPLERRAADERRRLDDLREGGRSVSRYPARLPLSTVEIYAGASGARVRVSYQLKKWPR